MKHIIKFSLNRRFKNKVTIILHVLVICISFTALFIDKVLEFFFEDSNEKIVVYYNKDIGYLFNGDSELFIYKEGYSEKDINIYYDNSWIIESEHSLDSILSMQLQAELVESISNSWFSTLNDDSIHLIMTNISPEINEKTLSKSIVNQDKMNMSMFLITGIYFAMISFSTMIANEVVYEKTSKVLELVLTSVSTNIHYFSKMIVAWLTVMIQIFSIVFEVAIAITVRNIYDQGNGLFKILNKYNLIENNPLTFKEFVVNLGIDSSLLYILSISLIYMLLGIVIVQMIMVCLSSYIKSIEESGGIQAPVYIIFLLVYYLALALNSPTKLNSGIGYYLSLSPIVSMLFMPMRLLLVKVSIYEILLGILLNLIVLVIFSYYGAKIYKYGILGGSIIKNRHIKEK